MATRIPNSEIPPYDAIGLLRMRFTDHKWYSGSGCLIDDRHILTCAHNLTDQGAHYPARALEVRFYPGWNQDPKPDDQTVYARCEQWYWPTAYAQGQDAWDVGVVRLRDPLARPFYFVPQKVTDKSLVGEELTLTGYPGVRQGEMWTDSDQVAGIELTTNSLLFTHDTWQGNSGSPVYLYDSVHDVVRQYAIHVSQNVQYGLRRGELLTAEVYDWVMARVAEAPAAAREAA